MAKKSNSKTRNKGKNSAGKAKGKGSKAGGKATRLKGRRIKFKMATIEPVIVKMKARMRIAEKVVAALEKGATAIDTPGFEGFDTPLDEAKFVVARLDAAIDALTATCPNDLSTDFVLEK